MRNLIGFRIALSEIKQCYICICTMAGYVIYNTNKTKYIPNSHYIDLYGHVHKAVDNNDVI